MFVPFEAYAAETSEQAETGAGIGGLELGILGTTLVMIPKLKKKKEEEAA